jgi:hypothetical protein
MAKRVHYNGASTLIRGNPEGGGKLKRTKLGALEIAAMDWASNPLPALPLSYPKGEKPLAEGAKKPNKKPKRQKSKQKSPRRVAVEKLALAGRRTIKGKIQSWSAVSDDYED